MWPSSFSFFRHSNVVARLPEYLVILVPMVIFLVIGRTTEIVKAGGLATPIELIVGSEMPADVTAIEVGKRLIQRAEVPTSLVNAGTAISKSNLSSFPRLLADPITLLALIALFFTPHIRTLPIHSTLVKTSRRWFPSSCLAASGILVMLCLPFALVPYYLLAKESSSSMPSIGQAGRLAGIFEALQVGNTGSNGDSASGKGFKTDSWLNFARVCMVVLILHSIVLWVAQAKDISLRALGIRREGRAKAQRWLSVCFWILVTGIACIGGRFADKLEWIGSACVISVGWLIPGRPEEVLPCHLRLTADVYSHRVHQNVPRRQPAFDSVPRRQQPIPSRTRHRCRNPFYRRTAGRDRSARRTGHDARSIDRRPTCTERETAAKEAYGKANVAGFDRVSRYTADGDLYSVLVYRGSNWVDSCMTVVGIICIFCLCYTGVFDGTSKMLAALRYRKMGHGIYTLNRLRGNPEAHTDMTIHQI